jgi:hypothetical protein
MEYASSVWDPTNREKIGNLEKVQKRAARFVFNTYTDRTPGCVTKMVESLNDIQVGAGLVAVRTRLEGAPESLYCVGRSCIRWQVGSSP